jgi:hypothetical protein
MVQDETGGREAHATAARVLETVERVLGDLVESPRTRALRNEAHGYARTMRSWEGAPPCTEDRAKLLARVHELHACALAIRMRHVSLAATKVPLSR